MVPFGRQQEVLRDLSTSSPEDLSETAGRLFIEGGVVVITNEKSACVQVSRIELDWLVGMSHGRL